MRRTKPPLRGRPPLCVGVRPHRGGGVRFLQIHVDLMTFSGPSQTESFHIFILLTQNKNKSFHLGRPAASWNTWAAGEPTVMAQSHQPGSTRTERRTRRSSGTSAEQPAAAEDFLPLKRKNTRKSRKNAEVTKESGKMKRKKSHFSKIKS